jgi:hypothetical protein
MFLQLNAIQQGKRANYLYIPVHNLEMLHLVKEGMNTCTPKNCGVRNHRTN